MATPTTTRGINRRHAMRAIATGLGGTASVLWASDLVAFAQAQAVHAHQTVAETPQASAWTPRAMSAHQFATVGTLVELIIPTTETPGAQAALVDRYVDTVLQSAAAETRQRFLQGLTWIDRRSRALFKKDFVSATPEQQADLLTRVSSDGAALREARVGVDFFTAIKGMTIAGYYTTEIGLRQELGDDPRMVLPAFEGCTHPEHQ